MTRKLLLAATEMECLEVTKLALESGSTHLNWQNFQKPKHDVSLVCHNALHGCTVASGSSCDSPKSSPLLGESLHPEDASLPPVCSRPT